MARAHFFNWFVINPWKDDDEVMNIWKSYMWTAEWRIIWMKIIFIHIRKIIKHKYLHPVMNQQVIYWLLMSVSCVSQTTTVGKRYSLYLNIKILIKWVICIFRVTLSGRIFLKVGTTWLGNFRTAWEESKANNAI